jgi:hypothetical protein
MLKEIVIILGEIGCIFLLLVLFGFMYPFGGFVETIAKLALLVFAVASFLLCILLVYSVFHIKNLLDNKRGRGAVCFSFVQAVTIILSFYVVSWVITNRILFGV